MSNGVNQWNKKKMVKIQLCWCFIVLLLHLQYSDGVSTGIVIVNNKQMKYNEKGELVEFIKVKKHAKEEDKSVKLVKFERPEEKSNFYKGSDFVTNHNFKNKIITKHDLTNNWNYAEPVTPPMEHKWNSPPSNTEANNHFNQLVQSNLNKKPTNMNMNMNMNNWNTQNPAMESLIKQFIQNNINKRKPLPKEKPMRSSTPRPVSHYQTLKYQSSIMSTTPFSTTLDDEITSQENSLNSTYEDIYKYEYMKYPVQASEPLQGETNPPVVIIYASPSPPPPDVSIHLPSRKKTKKKNKMKTTPKPVPDHKEFLQNVEYFKKNLMFNCSLADGTTHDKLNAYMTMPTPVPVINITPKPIEIQDENNDEKTIIVSKKKIKKGQGHGGSHGAGHGGYGGGHGGYGGGHGGHGGGHGGYGGGHGGHGGGHGGHGGGHGGHGGGHGGHKKKKQDKEITVYVKPVELNHAYSEHSEHDDHGGHGGNHGHGHGHKHKHKVGHKDSESEDDHSDDSEESKGNDSDGRSDGEPSNEHFSEAGGIWDSFYNYMEGSFTSKEIVESHHRKKKDTSHPMTNKNQKRQTTNTVMPTNARKSVTTNVHVQTDLGNSVEATTPMTRPVQIIKKPSKVSSEEDEDEYPTFYDQMMGFRGDEDDELDDEELDDDDEYENIQINRLPYLKQSRNKTEDDYSDEEEEETDYSDINNDTNPPPPTYGFMDTFSTAVSKFGSFLSSLTGYRGSLDYEDEGRRTTTPRIEPQSKRPKRQQQPWYYPMFVNYPLDQENEIMTGPLDSQPPTSSSWFEPPWTWFEKPSSQLTPTTSTTPNPVSPFLPPPNSLMNIWSQIIPEETTETTIVPQNRPTRKSYKNYQLWRLYPKTKEEVEHVEEYRVSPAGLKVQWWQGTTLKGITDVLVPPKHEEFKEHLEDGSIQYEIINRDIQTAIHFENPRLNKREQIELEIYNGHPMTWYRYHRYAEIRKYLEFLQRKYKKFVELEHIGYSFEGRPLTIVKVSYPISKDVKNESKQHRNRTAKKLSTDKKPAVFIESGANAREWLPVASSTYILNTIVENINNNDTLGELIRSVDWYFMVLMNPDGYEYSFNYDRLWQKTRSKHPDVPAGFISSALTWLQPVGIRTSGDVCYGTDANRNFDYLWNEFGTSNYECSDYYGGPYVESEPETKLFSNFLMSYKKQIKLYISLHSYGQKISYPISGVSKEDLEELEDIARAGIRNLKNSRLSPAKYTVDPMNEMSYRQSGTSAQFAMHRAQIKHSFTIELRDSGTHGFLVPASSIEDSSLELFEIVKGMISQLI